MVHAKLMQRARLIPISYRSIHSSTSLRNLVSEPFKIENARKMRDNNDVFARPQIVSFDGFGTIYYPSKPVHEQYHEIGSKMGLEKSAADIEKDFGSLYQELQREYPNYGREAGLESPDKWWLELIVKLFNIPHYTKDESSAQLCQTLLDHFTTEKAYRLYDDVIPVLSILKEHEIPAVVATNSDPRVRKILKNLGVSNYINDSNIYVSYDYETEKPDRRFYIAIAKDYWTAKTSQSRLPALFLENCWHVGDDYNKDFLGAVRAGWNGVYLDRQHQSPFFSGKKIPVSELDGCFMSQAQELASNEDFHIIANNRVVISNLTQILRAFDLEGPGKGEGI